MSEDSGLLLSNGYLAVGIGNSFFVSEDLTVIHTSQLLRIEAPGTGNSAGKFIITVNNPGNGGTAIPVGPGNPSQLTYERYGYPTRHAGSGSITFVWDPTRKTLDATFEAVLVPVAHYPAVKLTDGAIRYFE